jgi:hypothetical protein
MSSRAAEERAQLEQEREVLREKLGRVIDREIAVISWEKAVARKEREVELKERRLVTASTLPRLWQRRLMTSRPPLTIERWPSRRRRPASLPSGQTWRPGPESSRIDACARKRRTDPSPNGSRPSSTARPR